MNKVRLHLKLEKLLPADAVEFAYDCITSKNIDNLVDIYVVNDEIKCSLTELSPSENLKRAMLHYFDSKLPAEMTTYTQLDKLAARAKREFDMIAMEALAEIIKDLEEI